MMKPSSTGIKLSKLIQAVSHAFFQKPEHMKLEAASKVKWEPEYIGKRMQDWLMNMGDWNISRKRFYGLPLPFYPCENCGKLTVVGSRGID